MTLHPTLSIAFAAALFSTSGCAPLGHGPSPVPLHPGQHGQVGGQIDALVNVDFSSAAPQFPIQPGGGTFWYRFKLDDDIEAFVEAGSLVSLNGVFPYANVGMRRYLHRSAPPESAKGLKEHISVGLEVSAGVVSGDVGLPTSLRLGGLPIWLTTHPSVGLFYYGFAYLPVGVAIQPIESLEITATMGAFLFSSNFDLFFPTAQIGSSYSW